MIVLASTLIVYNDIVDVICHTVIGYLLYEASKMEPWPNSIWVIAVSILQLYFGPLFRTCWFTARNVE